MKARYILILILALLFSGLMIVPPAHADGVIIPQPPICATPFADQRQIYPCPPVPSPMEQLAVKYHHVTVHIENQIAVTHVDQVFFNPNDHTIEGSYLFPLPAGAAVDNFSLWIDGNRVKGEILDAAQARQKYEDIGRSLRDPALLEYSGRGAVQASLYPIPPHGERRIELEYTQALVADNGLVHYVYPLNTEKFSALPLEDVAIRVEIDSPEPIRAVYSPTHPIDVQRPDSQHAQAGYEAKNLRPDSDFGLYYSVGESQAFHLLTFRDPNDPLDPDGFFLALLAPKQEVDDVPLPKDILLVLDHSGSMEGEKFKQAQDALRYILKHLNPQDRFNIITFGSSVETYRADLRPTDEAAEALLWVDGLSARGSTDINRALLEAAAMADTERPIYLIFLTDGLPTVGETDSNQILKNFSAAARSNLRVFSFGVGYDVDTVLLDTLSQGHHGASSYVRPGDPLDEMVSTFYARVSTPVLTDLKLDFQGISTYDLYPSPLPDLFAGSQIVVVGRYSGGGSADVTLSGQVNGQTQTFPFRGQTFSQSGPGGDTTLAAIPRLWATRKIGYLLTQIRLSGNDPETIQQIVKLSIRYGIVTPYTSYLVSEPMPLGEEAQSRIAQEQYNDLQAAPQSRSGKAAVESAAGQGGMQAAEAPAAPLSADNGANVIRIAGSRTFVWNNDAWTDTAFDPQKMTPTRVGFLSEDYFKLLDRRPELAPVLALGEKVIFLLDGKAYQVVEGTAPQIVIPVTATPTDQFQPTATTRPTAFPQPTTSPTDPKDPAPASPLCLAALLPLGLLIFFAKALKGGS
ncbi:MAG TPA: VIT domain-containing protein [Anaerolineaceae bacterium]|nr:VIT domain-containing protein [Anaerolineaceae bacterium]